MGFLKEFCEVGFYKKIPRNHASAIIILRQFLKNGFSL